MRYFVSTILLPFLLGFAIAYGLARSIAGRSRR
jgi:hypothetical protein